MEIKQNLIIAYDTYNQWEKYYRIKTLSYKNKYISETEPYYELKLSSAVTHRPSSNDSEQLRKLTQSQCIIKPGSKTQDYDFKVCPIFSSVFIILECASTFGVTVVPSYLTIIYVIHTCYGFFV